jgi:farnesyl-diphosphate farnesyltransferase
MNHTLHLLTKRGLVQMSESLDLHKDAMDMLMATSRTFFIPISRLSPGLKEAVSSAYLCMRAIDEIEDHPQLSPEVKVTLLRSISTILQQPINNEALMDLFDPYKSLLPEVTLRLTNWTNLSPSKSVPSIMKTTATMSVGMAEWVSKEWKIQNEEDLDQYTFYVAGLVGVLLSDLWKQYEGIDTDQELAVAFGRGLQAVNIIRNRGEDLSRGVDFFPDGWGFEEMFLYARRNLALADKYSESIKPGPVLDFCRIPLALAHGTLDALALGEEKLTRDDVIKIVSKVSGE